MIGPIELSILCCLALAGYGYYKAVSFQRKLKKWREHMFYDPAETGVATVNNSGGESATPGNEPVEGSPI